MNNYFGKMICMIPYVHLSQVWHLDFFVWALFAIFGISTYVIVTLRTNISLWFSSTRYLRALMEDLLLTSTRNTAKVRFDPLWELLKAKANQIICGSHLSDSHFRNTRTSPQVGSSGGRGLRSNGMILLSTNFKQSCRKFNLI